MAFAASVKQAFEGDSLQVFYGYFKAYFKIASIFIQYFVAGAFLLDRTLRAAPEGSGLTGEHRTARHLLDQVPYKDVTPPPIALDARELAGAYDDRLDPASRHFVPQRY